MTDIYRYCNPRYDFPTQDESLEVALNILRQKKLALEKVGKKFSSVLIICGTYTIGKICHSIHFLILKYSREASNTSATLGVANVFR